MSTLHKSTFRYLMPTDAQKATMSQTREATADYADVIDLLLPDGPDKTYVMRRIRETAMWINVTITRHPDGSPRT